MKRTSMKGWLLCALCAAMVGIAGCSGDGNNRAATGDGGIGNERSQIREAETALASARDALQEVRDTDSATTQGVHQALMVVREAANALVELLITQGTRADEIATLQMEVTELDAEIETLAMRLEREPIINAVREAITKAKANTKAEIDVEEVSIGEGGVIAITVGEGKGSTWSDGRQVQSIAGWDGAGFTRTSNDGAKNEAVVVYTDVGHAPMRPFHEVHGENTFDPQAAYGYMLTNEDRRLIVAGDAMETEDDDEEADSMWTASGTFNGVEGQFSCAGDSCGQRPRVGWVFTPDDATTLVTAPDGRTDWLTYGVWISESVNEGATQVSGVELFADGTMPYTGNTKALTGTARYEGSAAGIYFMDGEAAEERNGDPYGWFTANTRLTAMFGDDASENGSIRGHIDGFTDQAGNEIDGWRLNLTQQELNYNADENTTTWVGTTAGDVEASGAWSGQFYGPATDDEGTVRPSGVAGEFTGIFSDGGVAGAYGARIPGS